MTWVGPIIFCSVFDTYQLELLVQNLGYFIVGSDALVDNVRGQVAFSDGTQDLAGLLVNNGQLIEALFVVALILAPSLMNQTTHVFGHNGNSVLASAIGHDGVRGLQVKVGNESGSPGLSGLLFFGRLEEMVLPHPIVVEELAHVVSDRVRQNADNTSTCDNLISIAALAKGQ